MWIPFYQGVQICFHVKCFQPCGSVLSHFTHIIGSYGGKNIFYVLLAYVPTKAVAVVALSTQTPSL